MNTYVIATIIIDNFVYKEAEITKISQRTHGLTINKWKNQTSRPAVCLASMNSELTIKLFKD